MDIKNLLALSMIKGIGPAFVKRNLNRIKSGIDCSSIIKEYKPDQSGNISVYLNEAEKIISDCDENGIEIVSILSPNYPSKLKEISDPPCILFIKGNKSLLNKCIAIIGTRHSTDLGNKIAEKLGSYFSKEYAICNGLVEGIDEHSIYINGQILPNVVGIISGGLCYEETCSINRTKVIKEVLNSGGLIISEYFPHAKEDQFSGSKASRIQAGLSNGLILVQSSVEGGSKYTLASYAKLGRALGVIHYPSSKEYNSDTFGANRLIVEHKNVGIAKMINLKTVSKLNIKSITVLQSKDDYKSFVQEISANNQPFDFGF